MKHYYSEIDKYIHKEIMGLGDDEESPYSADIKYAWQVVNKVIAKRAEFVLESPAAYNGASEPWTAKFFDEGTTFAGFGATPSLAICEAARAFTKRMR